MKRSFPLLSIFFLMTMLCGCNDDVFIDSFAPSTDKMQVPVDGSASTLRFENDNWYVRGLFWEKDDTYEEIRGDIYASDGNLLYFNASFNFNDLGQAKCVARYPKFALTLERTGPKELRLSDAENIGLDTCCLALGVGNDYEYREIKLLLAPSPRYRLDSIVYSLDFLYAQSAMTRSFREQSFNYTSMPVEFLIYPYANSQRTFTFAGGDLWSPGIDPSLFQMFGTEMPVVPVPQLDLYSWPALLGAELPLSGDTYELPLSDEWLAVTDTVAVPPGKMVDCIVECKFRFTGIPYKIYASCPQTGRRRVLEGRADLYDPQDYSLTVTECDVDTRQ